MPEIEHTAVIRAPLDAVWDFCKDMDNWAPYFGGYQHHEILSDTESQWTVKGDIGILTRTVNMQVQITEWKPEEKVVFILKGLNEAMEGEGAVLMTSYSSELPPPPASTRRNWLWWLRNKIIRFFYDLALGGGAVQKTAVGNAPNTLDVSGSQITIRLAVNALGVTSPMINAMIGPLLEPYAADVANKIAARIEELQTPT
jgi:carbon monoxide dehydrogenase subunit G